MTKDSAPPAARPVDARPTATVNLEPIGERAGSARGYSVRLHLPLSNFDEKFADRVSVLAVAQRALGDLGDGEAPHYFDVVSAKGKLLAIDASMVHGESLDAQAIGRLRETLSGAGYHVAIRTVRECTNDACGATMPMDASRPEATPTGWFSADVCGKHGFRSCAGCNSVYLMSSTNAAGQAPSVHCEVCGAILVEWGGTKQWTVDLVTRGGRSDS